MNTQRNSILGAPINLNLDGSFVIPQGGVRFVAGNINPDLRLHHLDAFLEQMAEAMEGSEVPAQLVASFPLLLDGMRRDLIGELKSAGVKLSISCIIDPKTHCMTYSFDMVATANPSSENSESAA